MNMAEREYGNESGRMADLYQVLAWKYMNPVGLADSAETYMNKVISIRKEVDGGGSESYAFALESLADHYYIQQKFLYAMPNYEGAIAIRKALGEGQDARIGRSYGILAKCYRGLGQYQKVLEFYKIALTYNRRAYGPEALELAKSYGNMGDGYYLNGKQDEALRFRQKALDIREKYLGEGHPDLATSYSGMGVVLVAMDKEREALDYFQKALDINVEAFGKEDYNVARCLSEMGTCYNRLGDYESALKNHEQALEIQQRTFQLPRLEVGKTYNSMGTASWYLGDSHNALEYFQASKAILISISGPEHPDMAAVYTGIGLAQADLGNFKTAYENFDMAIKAANSQPGLLDSRGLLLFGNIGFALFLQKDYSKALEYFQLGEELFLKESSRGSFSGIFHLNYGHAHLGLGEVEQAMSHFRTSASLLKEQFGPKNPKVSFPYIGMGMVYEEKGESRAALDMYQKAINSLCGGISYRDHVLTGATNKITSRSGLLRALGLKARVLADQYRGDEGAWHQLRSAMETSRLAAGLIDSMWVDHSEAFKVEMQLTGSRLFEIGIEAANLLQRDPNEENALNVAWKLAEKNKAGLLLQAIRELNAKQVAGIPQELVEQDREQKILMSYYNKRAIEETAKSNPEEARLSLYQAKSLLHKRQRDSLLAIFKTQYPKYYQLKYKLDVAAISQVQSYLSEDEALIAYFHGDSNVYVFSISPTTFHLHAFANDSTFKELLHEMKGRFQNAYSIQNKMATSINEYRDFSQSAFELYQLLLAPAIDSLPQNPRHLILIPDGPLGTFPFDILLTQRPSDSDQVNYRDLPYLLRTYRTSYAWSATVLLEDQLFPELQNTHADYNYGLLAIAPPYATPEAGEIEPDFDVPRDSLDLLTLNRTAFFRGGPPKPLRFTKPEAKALQDRFGAEILIDTNATEEQFEKMGSQARILHIGAHGMLNPDHPEYSNIALLPSASDSGQYDGRLHISEIYNLELKAELVVLPVCNSGAGENQRGEGILSMARAFRYAGCENVVASQWEVDDESAMQVSLNFYENLSQGMGKAEALRRAKLKQLEEGGTDKAHPFYWAPMVLIGEDTPVELQLGGKNEGKWKTAFLALGLIFLLSGILWRLKAVKSRKTNGE